MSNRTEADAPPARSARRALVGLLTLAAVPLGVGVCALEFAGLAEGAAFVGALWWLVGRQLLVAALVSSRSQAMSPAVYVLLSAVLVLGLRGATG